MCTVCSSPDVDEINRALRAGRTYTATAGRYEFSRRTLTRHGANCLQLPPRHVCPVCAHPSRREIEEQIQSRALSYQEIGRFWRLGGAVRSHARNHLQLERTRGWVPDRFSDAEKAAMVERWRSGETLRSIADTCGVSVKVVFKLMHKLGESAPSQCKICRHPLRHEIEAELAAQEVRYATTASNFNVPISSLRHHAKQHARLPNRDRGILRPDLCLSCSHPLAAEINERIRSGDSYGQIGNDFGIPAATVSRHAVNHLGVTRGTATCGPCGHPARSMIDRAILNHEPHYAIAETWGFVSTTVSNHARNHVGYWRDQVSRSCTICNHPDRQEIEESAIERMSANARRPGLASVGREFGVSPTAIKRHMGVDHMVGSASTAARRLAAVERYVAS